MTVISSSWLWSVILLGYGSQPYRVGSDPPEREGSFETSIVKVIASHHHRRLYRRQKYTIYCRRVRMTCVPTQHDKTLPLPIATATKINKKIKIGLLPKSQGLNLRQ